MGRVLWVLSLFVCASLVFAETVQMAGRVSFEVGQDLNDARTVVRNGVEIERNFGSLGCAQALIAGVRGELEGNLKSGLIYTDRDSLREDAGFTKGRAGGFFRAEFAEWLGLEAEATYVWVDKGEDNFELRGAVILEKHIAEAILGRDLVLKAVEHFAYDIIDGRGERNWLEGVVSLYINPDLAVGFKWYHWDVIHGPDTDEPTVFVQLFF